MEKKENDLLSNSIQICELIQGENKKIVGIYDISSQNIERPSKNDIFDKYYESFGNIYDVVNNSSASSIFKLQIFLLQKAKEFENLNTDLKLDNTNHYEAKMTLSQFKVKVGLLICQYINKYKSNDMKVWQIINELILLFPFLQKLKYHEIYRIIVFSFNEKIDKDNNLNIKLRVFSLLEKNKNTPYLLAYNFNKEEIKCLGEFSPLFQAYLQLNSFICYNYIHNRQSYTFSLELLFMIKFQLLSTYEDFFFIEKSDTKELAITDSFHQITIINEKELFNGIDISSISNIEEAKNYAMPISICFKHEKGGHYKYLLKNINFAAPFFYYRKLNIEIEIDSSHGFIRGESGVLLENFICPDKQIMLELSTKFIYGDLFKIDYFNGKDFQPLIDKIKQRMEKNIIHKINDNKTFDNKIKNIKIYNSLDQYETLCRLPPIFYHGDMILDINRLKENIIFPKDKIREINIDICKDIKKKALNKRNNINRIKKIK